MGIQKGKDIELTISGLAFGGKGFAKPEGYPVFVDRALPGDRVLVRVTKKKKSYAEARIVSMIEPSRSRQIPPCRYADYCGGCRWQALPYDLQLQYKKSHVREALEHIGLVRDVPVLDVIPSARQYGYRNKMEFSCVDRRWLLPEELGDEDAIKDLGIGLHVPGTFDRVIDIETCLIQPDMGNLLLEHIRQFIRDSGVPAYGLRTHEGFWRFVMLRSSEANGTWMVNLVTRDENDTLLVPFAQRLMKTFPQVRSVVNNVTARKAGISTGEYEKLLAGEQVIMERLGSFTFEISANSFFQTNTSGAEKLYSLVSDYAGLTGTQQVIDLYSGTGTIPIWLSQNAAQVTGIEIVESAVEDARRNAMLNAIDNCRFLVGDIKDILPGLGHACDVMIIDPPRIGMHRDVVDQVMAIAPPRIVYVSCNPSTLARDLGMLKNRYRAVKIQPVDMFPHTFHIESVALLEHC
ncbi:MAG: 23S rRNA (uracil(1939)-C(5))-methyltransferase RlmD [Pseudomonadota bacterium]